MEKIDFNNNFFTGFEQGEDILVDTSVLLALVADYDPWHQTVLNLFNRYIFPEESIVLLYTNPIIINEVLHLSNKSLVRFIERFEVQYSNDEKREKKNFIENMLQVLIEEKVLRILDGDLDSVIRQIKLSETLGAADAANASIANSFGSNFLTTDRILADKIEICRDELPNIKKVYYTIPKHRDYHTR